MGKFLSIIYRSLMVTSYKLDSFTIITGIQKCKDGVIVDFTRRENN